jgi:hypothetical protein
MERKLITATAATLCALAATALAATTLSGAFHSVWHDEAYTIVNYISGAPAAVYSEYQPNNHILFSLSAAALGWLIAEHEAVYRLASIVPALLAALIMARWLWSNVHPFSAVSALTVTTVLPVHLHWVSQARGYGLAILASTLLIIAGIEFVRQPTRARLFLIVMATVVGSTTLPHFLIPAAFITLAITYYSPWRITVGFAQVAAAGISFLVFAPVLAQMFAFASYSFGATLEIPDIFFGTFTRLISADLDAFGSHTTQWLPPTLLCMSVAAFFYYRSYDRGMLAIPVLSIVGTLSTLYVFGFSVTHRNLLILLPMTTFLVALGFGGVLQTLLKRRWLKFPTIAGIATVVLVSILGISSVAINWRSQPYENFKRAAAIAMNSQSNSIVVSSKRPVGLDYYLDDDTLWFDSRKSGIRRACELAEETNVAYVDHPVRRDRDQLDAVSCLENWRLVRVKQRGRGHVIGVWLSSV